MGRLRCIEEAERLTKEGKTDQAVVYLFASGDFEKVVRFLKKKGERIPKEYVNTLIDIFSDEETAKAVWNAFFFRKRSKLLFVVYLNLAETSVPESEMKSELGFLDDNKLNSLKSFIKNHELKRVFKDAHDLLYKWEPDEIWYYGSLREYEKKNVVLEPYRSSNKKVENPNSFRMIFSVRFEDALAHGLARWFVENMSQDKERHVFLHENDSTICLECDGFLIDKKAPVFVYGIRAKDVVRCLKVKEVNVMGSVDSDNIFARRREIRIKLHKRDKRQPFSVEAFSFGKYTIEDVRKYYEVEVDGIFFGRRTLKKRPKLEVSEPVPV